MANEWKNFRASFWRHIRVTYLDTGERARMEGQDLNTEEANDAGRNIWVEPMILEDQFSDSARSGARNESLLCQIDHYAKVVPKGDTTPMHLTELIDKTLDTFGPDKVLTLLDIATDSENPTTIGYLQVMNFRIQNLSDTQEDEHELKYTATFELRLNQ